MHETRNSLVTIDRERGKYKKKNHFFKNNFKKDEMQDQLDTKCEEN